MKFMGWRKKRKKILIAEISGDALIRLEQLAEKMKVSPVEFLGCALGTLEWIVQYTNEGGELVGRNGEEEFDIVFAYENEQRQIITIHSEDDYHTTQDSKPRKTIQLTKEDKRFFKKLGIEPD